MTVTLLQGDCLSVLRDLSAFSVQTCVTSPPYYGLRDYGVDGQIGLEETPEQFIEKLVAVFREVRRVFKDDGLSSVSIILDLIHTLKERHKPAARKRHKNHNWTRTATD